MKIRCPECGARYRLAPGKVLKGPVRVRCSRCANIFRITPPPPASKPADTPKPSPPRIVVIDDARFFREMVADILTSLPAEVLTASDGVQGLGLVRRERPDLVVLDLNLPEMDGFDLIRLIRADAALRGVRILAMSAVFRREDDIGKAMKTGADAFIPKSFRPDQLLERVRQMMDGR